MFQGGFRGVSKWVSEQFLSYSRGGRGVEVPSRFFKGFQRTSGEVVSIEKVSEEFLRSFNAFQLVSGNMRSP